MVITYIKLRHQTAPDNRKYDKVILYDTEKNKAYLYNKFSDYEYEGLDQWTDLESMRKLHIMEFKES